VNALVPDSASCTLTAIETGTMLPFGGHTSDGVGAQLNMGGVLSIFTLTDRDDTPPTPFTALQVSVTLTAS